MQQVCQEEKFNGLGWLGGSESKEYCHSILQYLGLKPLTTVPLTTEPL